MKLFTKAEDLPVNMRKSDSGVKWDNGWIRFDVGKAQRLHILDSLTNYGIRTKILRQGEEYQNKHLFVRAEHSGSATGYSLVLDANTLAALKFEDGATLPSFWNVKPPAVRVPVVGEEYTLEWACVGSKLVARYGTDFVQVTTDASFATGGAFITGGEPIRDIEVINLDGLPEAEALRLLGVDEKGNDLHGKTGAPSASTTPTPVWRDALAEAPLKKVIATANHTDKGYLLPPGNHWSFPAQPVRAGAIRVVAVTEAGSPNHLSLNFGLPGTRDHYQVFFRRKLNECGLAYLKEGLPERRLALKKGVHLADGQPFEFLLARIADEFYFLLNGQVILQAAEPDPTARYLTLNCFGDTHARVQKVEYLNLDGVSEEEALKLAGIFAASASPSLSVSSAPASANKAAPFINTLGMKFVPVPITGGPTDKQRVLFSVWETRVQDYEAFAKETKREWPKTSFEQGPTHPAVNVSRNDVMAFCIWLTETEKKAGKLDASLVYRLPSDHEWSCAVGIGDKEDPAVSPKDKATKFDGIYPWGVAWPPPVGSGNFSGEEIREHPVSPKQKWIAGYRDDFPATSPTGSFAANSLGLFDLSGNAWERTNDWLDASHAHQVLRGGSFYYSGRTVFSISNRFPGGVEESGYDCGFRIVLAAVAAPTTGRADSPKPPSDGSHAPASKPGALGQSALPSAATKDTPFVNTLGMKFVPVPIPALNASRSDAGGGPTGGQRVLFSVWETRVQDYAAFLKETKREWGKVPFEQGPTHPVVGPNWDDAQAFCDWLTETERKTGKLGANERYRLPSDHEWSCAVDLGDKEDTSKLPAEKHLKIADVFPWGTQWPPPKGAGNFAGEEMQPTLASGKFSNIKGEMPGYHDGFVNTSPVGSFAANRFGLYDMGGNVWQWCADWADGSQKARVLRGSSSQDRDRMFLQSSFRNRYQPQAHMINHGFRCVLKVP